MIAVAGEAVDDDVGARLSGHASRSTEVSKVTSLSFASVESVASFET